MDSNKKLWIAVVVVAIIAVVSSVLVYKLYQVRSFGSVGTRFPNGLAVGSTATVTQNKLTVGNSGTAIGQLIHGTCDLVSTASIAATSTGAVTCAIPGLLASDKVFVSLATTSVAQSRDLLLVGTFAASESATVRILNLTGAAIVPGSVPGYGSSTSYVVLR